MSDAAIADRTFVRETREKPDLAKPEGSDDHREVASIRAAVTLRCMVQVTEVP